MEPVKFRSIEINLLQDLTRTPSSPTIPWVVYLALFAVVAFGVTGWLWYDADRDVRTTQAELDAMQARIDELLKARKNTISETTVAEWLALPSVLRGSGPSATEVLDRLIAKLPAYSNLNGLVYFDGKEMTVTVGFATADALVRGVEALRQEPTFAGVEITGVSRVPLPTPSSEPASPAGDWLPVVQATIRVRIIQPSPSLSISPNPTPAPQTGANTPTVSPEGGASRT